VTAVALEFIIKTDTLDLLIDFVYGVRKPGDVQMGSSYSQPDFKALNKVISACMNEKYMIAKYNKKD